jgi:precorrin-8X/cobalt-precorrin-8 methylmutase
MSFITQPMAIEKRSMEIIAPYLTDMNLSPEAVKVFSRIIHAAGDPAYAEIIDIHPEAIRAGCQALYSGCHIYTDVEMVRTGINHRRLAEFGGEVHCLIADAEVAAVAKQQGITRSMAAMRAFGSRLDGAVVAIGNAPTALFEVLELIQHSGIRPALIVGVPVGFVGAAESKALLAETSPVPYITVKGTKGGSPIAAATVNALLYMQDQGRYDG